MMPERKDDDATTRRMPDVKAVIESRTRKLVAQPFIANLESSSAVDEVRAFVPQLYFYVFAFQDVLRIAYERVNDPRLREIARRHRDEDAGHEGWFALDVEELGCTRDVVWIFGAEHQPTRDFSYELLAELLHTSDDRVRVVFPLILEATGSIFFFRVIDLLERAGFRGRLRYFARSHQQVEAEHDIFTMEGVREIDTIEFEPPLYDEAVALVHRCFDHFERWGTHLETYRASARPSP